MIVFTVLLLRIVFVLIVNGRCACDVKFSETNGEISDHSRRGFGSVSDSSIILNQAPDKFAQYQQFKSILQTNISNSTTEPSAAILGGSQSVFYNQSLLSTKGFSLFPISIRPQYTDKGIKHIMNLLKHKLKVPESTPRVNKVIPLWDDLFEDLDNKYPVVKNIIGKNPIGNVSDSMQKKMVTENITPTEIDNIHHPSTVEITSETSTTGNKLLNLVLPSTESTTLSTIQTVAEEKPVDIDLNNEAEPIPTTHDKLAAFELRKVSDLLKIGRDDGHSTKERQRTNYSDALIQPTVVPVSDANVKVRNQSMDISKYIRMKSFLFNEAYKRGKIITGSDDMVSNDSTWNQFEEGPNKVSAGSITRNQNGNLQFKNKHGITNCTEKLGTTNRNPDNQVRQQVQRGKLCCKDGDDLNSNSVNSLARVKMCQVDPRNPLHKTCPLSKQCCGSVLDTTCSQENEDGFIVVQVAKGKKRPCQCGDEIGKSHSCKVGKGIAKTRKQKIRHYCREKDDLQGNKRQRDARKITCDRCGDEDRRPRLVQSPDGKKMQKSHGKESGMKSMSYNKDTNRQAIPSFPLQKLSDLHLEVRSNEDYDYYDERENYLSHSNNKQDRQQLKQKHNEYNTVLVRKYNFIKGKVSLKNSNKRSGDQSVSNTTENALESLDVHDCPGKNEEFHSMNSPSREQPFRSSHRRSRSDYQRNTGNGKIHNMISNKRCNQKKLLEDTNAKNMGFWSNEHVKLKKRLTLDPKEDTLENTNQMYVILPYEGVLTHNFKLFKMPVENEENQIKYKKEDRKRYFNPTANRLEKKLELFPAKYSIDANLVMVDFFKKLKDIVQANQTNKIEDKVRDPNDTLVEKSSLNDINQTKPSKQNTWKEYAFKSYTTAKPSENNETMTQILKQLTEVAEKLGSMINTTEIKNKSSIKSIITEGDSVKGTDYNEAEDESNAQINNNSLALKFQKSAPLEMNKTKYNEYKVSEVKKTTENCKNTREDNTEIKINEGKPKHGDQSDSTKYITDVYDDGTFGKNKVKGKSKNGNKMGKRKPSIDNTDSDAEKNKTEPDDDYKTEKGENENDDKCLGNEEQHDLKNGDYCYEMVRLLENVIESEGCEKGHENGTDAYACFRDQKFYDDFYSVLLMLENHLTSHTEKLGKKRSKTLQFSTSTEDITVENLDGQMYEAEPKLINSMWQCLKVKAGRGFGGKDTIEPTARRLARTKKALRKDCVKYFNGMLRNKKPNRNLFLKSIIHPTSINEDETSKKRTHDELDTESKNIILKPSRDRMNIIFHEPATSHTTTVDNHPQKVNLRDTACYHEEPNHLMEQYHPRMSSHKMKQRNNFKTKEKLADIDKYVNRISKKYNREDSLASMRKYNYGQSASENVKDNLVVEELNPTNLPEINNFGDEFVTMNTFVHRKRIENGATKTHTTEKLTNKMASLSSDTIIEELNAIKRNSKSNNIEGKDKAKKPNMSRGLETIDRNDEDHKHYSSKSLVERGKHYELNEYETLEKPERMKPGKRTLSFEREEVSNKKSMSSDNSDKSLIRSESSKEETRNKTSSITNGRHCKSKSTLNVKESNEKEDKHSNGKTISTQNLPPVERQNVEQNESNEHLKIDQNSSSDSVDLMKYNGVYFYPADYYVYEEVDNEDSNVVQLHTTKSSNEMKNWSRRNNMPPGKSRNKDSTKFNKDMTKFVLNYTKILHIYPEQTSGREYVELDPLHQRKKSTRLSSGRNHMPRTELKGKKYVTTENSTNPVSFYRDLSLKVVTTKSYDMSDFVIDRFLEKPDTKSCADTRWMSLRFDGPTERVSRRKYNGMHNDMSEFRSEDAFLQKPLSYKEYLNNYKEIVNKPILATNWSTDVDNRKSNQPPIVREPYGMFSRKSKPVRLRNKDVHDQHFGKNLKSYSQENTTDGELAPVKTEVIDIPSIEKDLPTNKKNKFFKYRKTKSSRGCEKRPKMSKKRSSNIKSNPRPSEKRKRSRKHKQKGHVYPKNSNTRKEQIDNKLDASKEKDLKISIYNNTYLPNLKQKSNSQMKPKAVKSSNFADPNLAFPKNCTEKALSRPKKKIYSLCSKLIEKRNGLTRGNVNSTSQGSDSVIHSKETLTSQEPDIEFHPDLAESTTRRKVTTPPLIRLEGAQTFPNITMEHKLVDTQVNKSFDSERQTFPNITMEHKLVDSQVNKSVDVERLQNLLNTIKEEYYRYNTDETYQDRKTHQEDISPMYHQNMEDQLFGTLNQAVDEQKRKNLFSLARKPKHVWNKLLRAIHKTISTKYFIKK